MKRREFITLLGGAPAWPLAALAQQFGKIPRLGVLVSLSAPHPFTQAFRSGLRDLGYIEGANIAIEWRYADAQFSRALKLAEELVQLPVDVIAAYHTPAVKAAMNATKYDSNRDGARRRAARTGTRGEPSSSGRERDRTV
jgi:putative tryptophan/tyrosine transport system substrate-binding protein